MGQRSLRAGQARDVEGERLRAAGPDQPLEAQRELRLGHARTDLRQERGQGPVRYGTGRRDPFDLRRFLDRPVGLDPALDRDELDVGRGHLERFHAACESQAASTATRRAPTDAMSSGQRAGRSL